MEKDKCKSDEQEQLLLKLEEGNTDYEGGATFVLFFSVFIAICGSFVCGCAVSSSPLLCLFRLHKYHR